MALHVKISTITLSTKLPDCQLNLTNVGKYLDIDDEIIGIKYNYADLSIMKGKYSTTIYKKAKVKDAEKIKKTLFYNQISIILNNSGNNVNVKLFGNGSLHLTGCKSIVEGYAVTRKIYDKLQTLVRSKDTILLTKDANGILVDKDHLVYSYDSKTIIGYCKDWQNKHYIINKKDYIIDSKTNMFITQKMETQRRHFIHNLNGEYIGYTRIELLKNRHKFYKNNNNIFFDIENGLIYYNNDTIIGKIIYDIDNSKITDVKSVEDIQEIQYECNPFYNSNYTLTDDQLQNAIDLNVNCMNVYFTIDYKINRQRFYERLIQMNYICKYKPESYSGIKFLYKVPLNEGNGINNGICPCTNKCTCINITFLIFQSGNVIATGFKTNEQVSKITEHFMRICNSVKDNIKQRLFTE
jgi:TATA-box binding protein (TBP) (component of TFIID and TFIIIB)